MSMSEPRKVSVLMVDDSACVRQRLRRLLKEEEHIHVVSEAGTAIDAIMQFEASRPDAVLLDIHLPDFSGMEVLRWVKRVSPHCVVIMLTNLAAAELQEACQLAGADHFFHKATEFEKAISMLNQLPLCK